MKSCLHFRGIDASSAADFFDMIGFGIDGLAPGDAMGEAACENSLLKNDEVDRDRV